MMAGASAWPLSAGGWSDIASRMPQRCLDVFQAGLELIGIESLGAGPETVAH